MTKSYDELVFKSVSKLLDSEGIPYTTSGLNIAIRRNNSAKHELRKLFDGLPVDAMGRFKIEVEYKKESKHWEITRILRSLWCDVTEQTELRKDLNNIIIIYSNIYSRSDIDDSNEKPLTAQGGIAPIFSECLKGMGFVGCSKGTKFTKFINTLIERHNKNSEYKLVGDGTKQYHLDRISECASDFHIRKTYCIGTNLDDFMNMSNGVSWSSCHSIDGDYHNGITGYANDTLTAIVYELSDDEKLISRRLLHFKGDAFYFARLYGSSEFNETICAELAVIIGKNNGLDVESVEFDAISDSRRLTKYSSCYRGYPDMEYHKGVAFKWSKAFNSVNVPIGESSICLSCGELYSDDVKHFSCNNCEVIYRDCESCGSTHEEEDLTYVCYRIDSRTYREGYYCEDCVVWTYDTGQYWLKEDCVDIDGCWYSKEYAYENFYCCEDCGEWVKEAHYIEDIGADICHACFNSSDYNTCSECGCKYSSSELTEVNGALYCDNCKPELEDELEDDEC